MKTAAASHSVEIEKFSVNQILREIDFDPNCNSEPECLITVFQTQNWPKLISRKICLVDKFMNFHTVQARTTLAFRVLIL